ncbi:MAG: NAD-dependent epimerase/dehydratase family protein [Bacteroidota bacterium]|nr:NAD-dependent epimerase/dehydratase family protein [Bacteroidota bacterium]
MQTILGSSGIIGTELAKNLVNYTDKVRLVSRNPQKINPSNEVFQADLLDAGQTKKAVAGSDVAYLTAGLKYDIKVWEAQWPVVMQNVIEACKMHNTKLVFFDNVYAYGKVNGWMTEETKVNPVSRKGEVRAKIASMILDEVKKGELKALIARAADFYGPNTKTSFINFMIIDNLKKGKKAQLLISDEFKHSLTYTPDAGKGTAILGNTDSAYNQIWHLPTDRSVLTTRGFVELAAKELGIEPRSTCLSKTMLRLIGMLNGIVKEVVEMLYQYDSDYLFSSEKFEKAFKFKPTGYAEGIKETINSAKE